MGKLANRNRVTVPAKSPIKTKTNQRTRTHEGAVAYVPTAKGELFKLAVSMLAGEDTFYESGEARMQRLAELVEKVVVGDPDWVGRLIPFVRNEMNLRTVSVAMAVEAAVAMRTHAAVLPEHTLTVRKLVDSALQRADEPGEFIAYWAEKHGRRVRSTDEAGHQHFMAVTLPGGVQRGLSDAVSRLFTEYAALKYDGGRTTWRLGDVVQLVHPTAKAAWQGALYEWLLDRRHGVKSGADTALLPMITANAKLNAIPVAERRAFLNGVADGEGMEVFRTAGITWEQMSGWLQGPLDASFWEALIPSMGYMALLRNLRNFDEAGISKKARSFVQRKLEDGDEVARSRQLPYRFWSAYVQLNTLHWGEALETALDLSLANIPALPGRSLVLIDTSASMRRSVSAKSVISYLHTAGLFGLAIAKRSGADVIEYASQSAPFDQRKGEALLRSLERLDSHVGRVGHGTDGRGALVKNFQRGVHERVFIISDEQSATSLNGTEVPGNVPVYTVNLGGYCAQLMPSGRDTNRHVLAGLGDATFKMVPLIEAGEDVSWPF